MEATRLVRAATAEHITTIDGDVSIYGSDMFHDATRPPARRRVAQPSSSDGGGSNAATEERLDDIFNAITAQNRRLEVLEQEQRAALAGQPAAAARAALRTGTGTFDDSDLAGINASDRELIAELMKARPKDPVARQTPSAVPEAEVNTPVAGERDASASDPALEQVAGRPSNLFNVEKVGPKFKLLGA